MCPSRWTLGLIFWVSRVALLGGVLQGRKVTHLQQILLNGNNIAVLVPGGGGADGPAATGGNAAPITEA